MREGTLLIVIKPEYLERLVRRATEERRTPREQAAYLVEQALEHCQSHQPEAVA